ncbi:dolichol-phosphate mannosyltransferase [Clostridia bacterium]|nr:dolichol-phosphate mannosyltransferase [Clostridia bacterium]
MEERKIDNLNVTVIIPSLNPDEKLASVVRSLHENGFSNIVLINDGSKEECVKFFPKYNEDGSENCILTHEINQGKGRALKTAFAYVLENYPETKGVVTVDGDDQHRAEDVVNCVREMLKSDEVILGVRDFNEDDVPWRSRVGNKITSSAFRMFYGLRISDTQTGLRAFPLKFLPSLLDVSGERYEYETNMLIDSKKLNIPLREVKIRTVYIENNQTSHFHPILDSLRIYKTILKFSISSGVAAIIDTIAFFIFSLALGQYSHSITISLILARIISSICNFILNKKLVFKEKKNASNTVLRYYILAVILMVLDVVLVNGISMLINASHAVVITLIKIVIECLLFVISFYAQRKWVFKQ